jgi:hypothetical protein
MTSQQMLVYLAEEGIRERYGTEFRKNEKAISIWLSSYPVKNWKKV